MVDSNEATKPTRRLYRVEVSYNLYAYAKDKDDAETVANLAIRYHYDADQVSVIPVEPHHTIARGWGNCTPFGAEEHEGTVDKIKEAMVAAKESA